MKLGIFRVLDAYRHAVAGRSILVNSRVNSEVNLEVNPEVNLEVNPEVNLGNLIIYRSIRKLGTIWPYYRAELR